MHESESIHKGGFVAPILIDLRDVRQDQNPEREFRPHKSSQGYQCVGANQFLVYPAPAKHEYDCTGD